MACPEKNETEVRVFVNELVVGKRFKVALLQLVRAGQNYGFRLASKTAPIGWQIKVSLLRFA